MSEVTLRIYGLSLTLPCAEVVYEEHIQQSKQFQNVISVIQEGKSGLNTMINVIKDTL
jgi:hypothetical protein